MDQAGEPKTALEQQMEDRLDELGISWKEVTERSGLSRQALLDIRRGISVPRRGTRRKLEQSLELAVGGFEQMERGEKPTPSSPSANRPKDSLIDLARVLADLATLDEILRADMDELTTMARMVARYLAKQEGREPTVADRERVMLWLLQTRADQGRGIKPPGDGNGDVS